MQKVNFFDLKNLTTEKLYELIGELIINAIDDDNWITARVFVEIEDNESGLTFGRYITTKPADPPLNFDTDYRMYLVFDEIRKRMVTEGKDAWVKAIFTLEKTGKFDIKFEYPT